MMVVLCTSCGELMFLKVCHSAAGFYLGYWCDNCGPYSRETAYFGTRKGAELELAAWKSQASA